MSRTISVTGRGTVTAAPDTATVTLGVTTHEASAGTALAKNNEAMADALARLRGQGVADVDLQTSGLRVQPRVEHLDQSGAPPRTVGYSVVNRLTANVRDLEALGDLLDELVRDGGVTNIDGVSFHISDPEPLTIEARKKAMADARARAELYATEAGAAVGPVLTISEQHISTPPPAAAMAQRRSAVESVPIATGEASLSCTINVLWELVD